MYLKKIAMMAVLIGLWGVPLSAQEEKAGRDDAQPVTVEISDHAAFSIAGQTITLGRAIELVLEQNRDTLTGAYDVAMTDSLYRKYQAKYSPNLSLEGAVKNQENPPGTAVLYGTEKRTWDLGASIAKMFETGTTVAAGVKHEYAKTEYIPININGTPIAFGLSEYHMPVVFASVKQELLKNSFGFSERREQEILKNQGKMQRDAIIYQLAGLVVGVVVDYWTLVIDSAALENAELQLRETRRVRNIMAANVRIGLAESFDLNYYNTLVANSEARAASARQKYRDTLRNLLQTLNLDPTIRLTGKALLSGRPEQVDLSASLKAAYAKRTDYNNALISLENAKMALSIYRNDALPSVTAEVNVSSLGMDKSMGTAYSDTGKASYPTWEAKVGVTYPLNDTNQKTNERNARFQVKQAEIQVDKYRRVVRDDVTAKVEHLDTYFQLYGKAKEATRQSEIYYGQLVANLRRGRFTASVVKNGLDAMVETRQRELEALVQYNVALLQLDLAKNELFDRYRIDVNKYIPK